MDYIQKFINESFEDMKDNTWASGDNIETIIELEYVDDMHIRKARYVNTVINTFQAYL